MKSRRFLLAGFLLIAVAACARNTTPPELAARKYATDLGMKTKGVSCTGFDTDNDGYVSCTLVTYGDGESETAAKTLTILCAAMNDPTGCTPSMNSAYAVGCKEIVPKVQVQATGS